MDVKNLPWKDYGLAWKPRPVTLAHYTLFATQVGVLAVLSYLSVALLGPLAYAGVSFFYFAYAFYITFALWWGLYGIAASYLGSVISGFMLGTGLVPNLLGSLPNLIGPLAAFVIWRGILSRRGLDPLMRDLTEKEIRGFKTKRAEQWFWHLLLNVGVFNILGAFIYVGLFVYMGLIPAGAYWVWWLGWVAGDVIPLTVITPLLIKSLTPMIERSGLINLGWLS